MRKIGILLLAAAVVAAVIWIVIAAAIRPVTVTAGANWPPDPSRNFPGLTDNESGAMLRHLARPGDEMPSLRPKMTKYIAEQFATGTSNCTAPAFAITGADHLREAIEREAPRWAVDVKELVEPPEPPYIAAQRAATLLTADGLAKCAAGDTATADRDFEAVFRIGRTLVRRPELESQLIGLSALRLANGAAAKLPPPEPAWHRELMAIDLRRSFQRTFAYHAWRSREFARRQPAGEPGDAHSKDPFDKAVAPLAHFIAVASSGREVAVYKQLETSLIADDACASPPLPRGVPNLESARRRVDRFRVEREGVANFFALRSGVPLTRVSACRSTQWLVTPDSVSFPRAMPVESQQTVIVPLTWKVR